MIADLGGLQFFYIPNRRISAEEIKAIIKKKDTPSTMHLFFLYFAIAIPNSEGM